MFLALGSEGVSKTSGLVKFYRLLLKPKVEKPVTEPVRESVFRSRLWRSLFLAKLEAFEINGGEGNSDRVCDFHF